MMISPVISRPVMKPSPQKFAAASLAGLHARGETAPAERLHVKARLGGLISEGAPDRACATCQTPLGHAVSAVDRSDVVDAALDVVERAGKRFGRACRQARLVCASVAGTAAARNWQVERNREHQCRSIGMPQPVIRMD